MRESWLAMCGNGAIAWWKVGQSSRRCQTGVWSKASGASPASWAFRWVGSHPNILVTLSGMTTMDVLQENVRTFSPLDPCTPQENDFMARIADQMAGIPVIPCTDCHYCLPCPYGVAIPSNFAVYNEAVNVKSIPTDKTAPDYTEKLEAFRTKYMEAIPETGRAIQCVDCEACLPKCPQQIRRAL